MTRRSPERWAVIAAIALSACRRDARPNLDRGDQLLSTGQHEQAIVEYQTALGIGPSARAERGLGLAYEALSAYALAQRHLSAALEARPEDAEARVALARVDTRVGQYGKARAELLTALAQDPQNESALLSFGVYAETRPQLQRALEGLDVYERRLKKLGRALTHGAQLVFADLLDRTNQSAAAEARRQSARIAPLDALPLTLALARAASERSSHRLVRAVLAPLVEQGSAGDEAWRLLALADLELGELCDARAALGHLSALAAEPDVRLLQARLDLARGLQAEPLGSLRELLQQLPPDQGRARAGVRRVLAAALLEQYQPDAAAQELEALLAEQPDDTLGALALSELKLQRGDYAEAARLARALAEQDGQIARAYAVLGRADLGLGENEAAEAAFRRAWELAPHQPGARYWLAQALVRRGQLDQARRLLGGNLDRFPAHVESLLAWLDVLAASSGDAAAKAALLEHGQKHPDSPAIASAEGEWLMNHADPERALAAHRRALREDPSYFPSVAALTRFYASHDRRALAASVIDGALARDPADVRVLLLAARAAGDEHRYDDARDYLRRASDADPGQPLALAARASIEAEGFRDFPHARDLAARARAAAPENAAVLDAVGWVSHLAGEPLHALQALQDAAQREPDDPRILYHLAAVLLAAGQAAAAHDTFQRVLRIDPESPTAREIRVLLAHR